MDSDKLRRHHQTEITLVQQHCEAMKQGISPSKYVLKWWQRRRRALDCMDIDRVIAEIGEDWSNWEWTYRDEIYRQHHQLWLNEREEAGDE